MDVKLVSFAALMLFTGSVRQHTILRLYIKVLHLSCSNPAVARNQAHNWIQIAFPPHSHVLQVNTIATKMQVRRASFCSKALHVCALCLATWFRSSKR